MKSLELEIKTLELKLEKKTSKEDVYWDICALQNKFMKVILERFKVSEELTGREKNTFTTRFYFGLDEVYMIYKILQKINCINDFAIEYYLFITENKKRNYVEIIWDFDAFFRHQSEIKRIRNSGGIEEELKKEKQMQEEAEKQRLEEIKSKAFEAMKQSGIIAEDEPKNQPQSEQSDTEDQKENSDNQSGDENQDK